MWWSNFKPDKQPDQEQLAMVRGLSFRVAPSGEMTYLLVVPGVYEARALAQSGEVRVRVLVDKYGIPESMAIER